MNTFRASQYLFWPINSYWADQYLLENDFDDLPLQQGNTICGDSIGHYAEMNSLASSETISRRNKTLVNQVTEQQQDFEEQELQKQLEKERIAEIEWNKQLEIEAEAGRQRRLKEHLEWMQGIDKKQDENPSAWALATISKDEIARNPYWTGR